MYYSSAYSCFRRDNSDGTRTSDKRSNGSKTGSIIWKEAKGLLYIRRKHKWSVLCVKWGKCKAISCISDILKALTYLYSDKMCLDNLVAQLPQLNR